MPFDFAPASRRRRGRSNYDAGRMAEDSVERHYEARGCAVADRRWRGESGEIDLILEEPDGVVFVEVKRSSTFERAAESLGPRQVGRICRAATEYVGRLATGSLTNMRFDLALVNGQGEVRVIENAFPG